MAVNYRHQLGNRQGEKEERQDEDEPWLDDPPTTTRLDEDDDKEQEEDTDSSTAVVMLTLDQVVERIGFGRFHWKLLLLCGVGYFAEITELVVVSFVAPSIQRQMHLSNLQYGALGSSSFVGMAAGALFWGYISDHLGRQISFAWTVWMTFVGGFFSALAPNYSLLLLLRFIAAFGIGGMLPVDYTVFLEFLPQRKRGSRIVLVDAIGIVPALTISATISWAFAGGESGANDTDESAGKVQWRYVLLISSIPVGIMAVLRRHVPESPRYHLAAGHTEKAQAVVQKVANENGAVLPVGWKLIPQVLPQQQQPPPRRTSAGQYESLPSDRRQPQQQMELSMQQLQVDASSYHNDLNAGGGDLVARCPSATALPQQQHSDHNWGQLLRDPQLRGTTYRLWMIYFLVQLSSAGMVFALPKLFAESFAGDKSEASIALDLLIGVVGLVPGLAIAFWAVERSRTRSLAAFLVAASMSVMAVGYTCLSLMEHGQTDDGAARFQLLLIVCSILLRGAMEGCFAILNTTAVESYPTLLRATGLGTAQIFDHIAGSISPVIFSALNGSETTRPYVFVIYSAAYMIAVVPALGLKEHAGTWIEE